LRVKDFIGMGGVRILAKKTRSSIRGDLSTQEYFKRAQKRRKRGLSVVGEMIALTS